MATQPIYTFNCDLQDVEPKVWRQVQIPGNRTVAQMCYIMMTLFEMQAEHLFDCQVFHQYTEPHTVRYVLGAEAATVLTDATRMTIKDAFAFDVQQAVMNYDYGDSWHVNIQLVEITKEPALDARQLPRVLDGAGFGIVENIGGADALMDLHDVFVAGTLDTAEFEDFLGGHEFDLTAFDQVEMNQRIKKIPPAYKQAYERGKPLSVTMVAYIERI
jgi:hypothetical protein